MEADDLKRQQVKPGQEGRSNTLIGPHHWATLRDSHSLAVQIPRYQSLNLRPQIKELRTLGPKPMKGTLPPSVRLQEQAVLGPLGPTIRFIPVLKSDAS